MIAFNYSNKSDKKAWTLYEPHFKNQKALYSYKIDINLYMEFTQKAFTNGTQIDAENYYLYCINKISQGKLKSNTVRKKFVILSNFADFIQENLQTLELEDYENPFKEYAQKLQQKCSNLAPLCSAVDVIDKLLGAASSNLMYYTILSLAYRGGLKPVEIGKIKMEDFYSGPDKMYLKITRDNKKALVNIPPDLYKILQQYIDKYERKADDYLFVNTRNRPLNTLYLSRMMKELVSAAGIDSNITLFSIRNSSLALAVEFLINDSEIEDQYGITHRGISRFKKLNVSNSTHLDNLVHIKPLGRRRKKKCD